MLVYVLSYLNKTWKAKQQWFKPLIPERGGAESGGSLVSLRPTWSIGTAQANDETLSQKKKKKELRKPNKPKPLTSTQNAPPVSNMLQGHMTHPDHLPPQPHDLSTC